MKQVFTDSEVKILKQLTQEDVDYVKRMVKGQKRSDEHSDRMGAFMERLKTGKWTREDQIEFGGTYFPSVGIKIPKLLGTEDS